MRGLAIAVLMLAGCGADPAPVPFDPFFTADLDRAGGGIEGRDSIRENIRVTDAPTADAQIGEPALARMFYGRTACTTAGGVNPMVYLPRARRPKVGQQFTVGFATRAGGTGPDEVSLLVMSHRHAAPIDFTPYGAPGCWLLVNFDLFDTDPDSGVLLMPTQNGLAHWNWTPPSWATGVHLWMQFVVFAPGQNLAGAIGSPGLELVAGQW